MKKVLYITATIIEAAGLAGAYAVQYFTRRKMGMARYVVYKNRSWEAAYPMELMTRGLGLAAVILAVCVLLYFLSRRRRASGIVWLMNASMIIMTAISAGFAWINSTANYRAYYFISGILAVVSLLQIVKTFVGTFVGTLVRRNEA